jgi:DNA helicase-2/ATP-dependent DNA helicase PcrA
MSGNLLSNLNPAQQQAVQAIDGPVLVLAGPGSGKCLLPSTRLIINDELLTADEAWSRFQTAAAFDGEGWVARPQEHLLVDSFNETTGKFQRAEITALYRQFIREPVRIITFRDGSQVGATQAHQFFDGLTWTNQIRAGDVLALPGCLAEREEILDLELAEFLGWLVGEGYERTQQGCIREFAITLKDERRLERIRELIRNIADRYGLRVGKLRIKPNPKRTTSQLAFWSTSFYNFLIEHGHDFGQRAAHKRVPDCVMHGHAEGVKSFLQALFDGEGWVEPHRNQVGYATASPRLAEEVRHLLRRYGVWARISRREKFATNGKQIRRPYWILSIGGPSLRLFADRIGFTDRVKAEALKACVARRSNPNRDLLPSAPIMKHLAEITDLAPKRLLAGLGEAPKYLQSKRLSRVIYNEKIRPTLVNLCDRQGEQLKGNQFRSGRILTADDVIHIQQGVAALDRLGTQALIYEQVKSVELIDYEGWVYDFTVEGTHNFVAENILCHNTRVLTHRIAYLIDSAKVDPYNIMAVTFTNKAAREMKDRLDVLLGAGRAAALTVGTFHAICSRFLRRDIVHLGRERDFAIYDSDDQQRVMKRVLKDLELDEKKYPPRSIHATISRAKNELVDAEEYGRLGRTYYDEVVTRCFKHYQKLLRDSNALDFDDLLVETVRLFEQFPQVLEKYQQRYRYLLADEYQDTNRAQYVLLKLLAAKNRNIFVVGDDDQSVYAFRGADIRNIRLFENDYPEARVILLEQNYRSTQAILDVAQAVIQGDSQRKHLKKLWTENDQGVLVQLQEGYDQDEEGQSVAGEIARLIASGEYQPGDIAIMYRTNAQSRAIEEALIARGLRYQIVGGTRFYERKEIKDALAYLRLSLNPYDSVSFSRVLNWPGRGIGERTEEDLNRWANAQGIPAYAALQLLAEDERADQRPETRDQRPETRDEGDSVSRLQSPFAPRTKTALLGFLHLIDELIAQREQGDLGELMDLVFGRVGFQEALLREYGEQDGSDRWNNVQELRNAAVNYINLPRENQLPVFLEEVALVSDVDQVKEDRDSITCITLHQAKGLEYPVVFIVGLEEGLLPHSRSIDDKEALEEERRLFYVGATRAKQRLYLLYAFRRTSYGRTNTTQPSRFLADIPKTMVKPPPRRSHVATQQSTMFTGRSTLGGGSGFGSHGAPTRPAASPGLTPARRGAPADDAPRAIAFFAGQKVRHATFGDGIVVSSKLVENDEEVTVAFTGKGVKRLLASFANLEKAE